MQAKLFQVVERGRVEENEVADVAAYEGRDLNRPDRPLPTDMTAAKSAIREVSRRRWVG